MGRRFVSFRRNQVSPRRHDDTTEGDQWFPEAAGFAWLKILVFSRRRQVSLEDDKLLRPLKGQPLAG